MKEQKLLIQRPLCHLQHGYQNASIAIKGQKCIAKHVQQLSKTSTTEFHI